MESSGLRSSKKTPLFFIAFIKPNTITVLTGKFKQDDKPVDLKSVVRVIDAVREDEAKKQMRLAEAKAALPKPKRF